MYHMSTYVDSCVAVTVKSFCVCVCVKNIILQDRGCSERVMTSCNIMFTKLDHVLALGLRVKLEV